MGRARSLLLALLLVALPTARAAADDEPGAERPIPPPGFVEVPDVRRLTPERAAQRLVFAGLNPGRLFDRQAQPGWVLGRVLQQRPAPGTVLAWGTPVDLAVSAGAEGPAEGRAPPADWPRVALPGRPRPAVPRAPPAAGTTPATVPGDRIPPPPPAPPTAPRPAGPAAAPPAVDPSVPPPPPPPPAFPPAAVPPAGGPPAEPTPPPAEPTPTGPTPDDDPAPVAPPTGPPPEPETLPGPPPVTPPGEEVATGSPDAPASVPAGDPAVTPALIGLPLADAEHLVAASDMQLHVERVPGHPVGRVTRQVPDPGAPRPPAGVVKVEVTAGGDHVAGLAPAPLVAVTEVAVPDLLDRTALQARRILEDLGLEPQVEAAARGPAGRVADQRPDAGTVVAKGATVIVRVAPDGPSRPAGQPSEPVPPEPTPPSAGGAPTPLAPAAGTLLGGERALAVGFTWRPLAGADAYVLEVEERGPDGWLPLARRSARTSAAVLEMERLAPSPGPLRWRVRAVTAGRQGAPCAWVVLR